MESEELAKLADNERTRIEDEDLALAISLSNVLLAHAECDMPILKEHLHAEVFRRLPASAEGVSPEVVEAVVRKAFDAVNGASEARECRRLAALGVLGRCGRE